MAINPDEFGASFNDFMEQMRSQKKPEEAPFFVRKLRDHFGAEPSGLPIVSQSVIGHDHPNMHSAIEAYIAAGNRSAEILGVVGLNGFMGNGLADLVAPRGGFGSAANQGPVEYANVELDGNRVVACIERGLFLVKEGDHRLAIFVRQEDRIASREKLTVEVMARERAAAERFLRDLREAMRVRNVYRGHVISLTNEGLREVVVKFHRLPEIERGSIILPAGLLERIERQTVGFGRHSRQLLEAGRHLKRGLLLHGPPGTGKTLTIMYLAGAMRDRTVFLLSGRGLGMVGRTCAMARALQPSIVVIEDVDLIAEDRTASGSGAPLHCCLSYSTKWMGSPTTPTFCSCLPPTVPISSSRPGSATGQVDQAIEIPPPDEECRRPALRSLRPWSHPRNRQPTAIHCANRRGKRCLHSRAAAAGRSLCHRRQRPRSSSPTGTLTRRLHVLVVQGGELTKSLLGFQSRLGFGLDRREWTPT